jgi:hypothetical protein
MPRLSTIVVAGALLAAAGTAADASGVAYRVLLFVTSDCPMSNGYAPEIRRICDRYRAGGVACTLVYEDARIDSAAVRGHKAEYGLDTIPSVVDSDRQVARTAGATVTPQVVVVDRDGTIRYRGRIDNRYAALGQPRQQITRHDLRDALDAVLAGKPVVTTETEALGCFIAAPPSGAFEHPRC